MTDRWEDLDERGRDTARAVFAALEAARQLEGASRQPSERPAASPSAVWSALVAGGPLPAAVVPGPDLEAMVERAAVAVFPRQAAAAIETGALDRRAPGVRVRIVASRADAGQSYVILTFDDPALAPARLVVLPRDGRPVDLDLPVAVDGAVQVLLDNTAPILAALTDPDARLYLV